jgi:hypothetical protein
MASTGGHAMRDEPKVIPEVGRSLPEHSALLGIRAATIMVAVWAVLILVALLWLGALVAKHLP